MQNELLPLAEASKYVQVAMNKEEDDNSDSRTLKKKRDVSAALCSGLASSPAGILLTRDSDIVNEPDPGPVLAGTAADEEEGESSSNKRGDTTDALMSLATEKKKRDDGKERSCNDKRKRAKAAKKAMTEEHRGN